MEITYSLNQINEVVVKTFELGKDRSVWAVHGEMGAGKTTFIHALCEWLGVKSAIGSPTYAIINEYHGANDKTIYHMDWYRLRDEEEALQAGVEDCLLSRNLCLVEWVEKAPGLIPDDAFHVHLQVVDPQTRRLTVDD